MAFDAENRVTRVWDVLSQTDYASATAYHPSGAMSGYKPGNSETRFEFTYHPQRYWPQTIYAGPLSLEYGYDEAGNVTSLQDGRGTAWNQTFTYDALDRLLQSNGPYGNIGYTYDDHGNMKTQGADTFIYNAELRLHTRNGQPVTYDLNGNITSGLRGSDTYEYNADNQMKAATVGTATTTFKYDPDQWRVKKVSGSVTTYYLRDAGGRLLTEMTVDGSNPPTYRDYIYAGSRLIAVVDREPEP